MPPSCQTDLSGMKLLTKSLMGRGAIGKYLDGLIDDRKSDWAEREFDKSSYVWRTPGDRATIRCQEEGGEDAPLRRLQQIHPAAIDATTNANHENRKNESTKTGTHTDFCDFSLSWLS